MIQKENNRCRHAIHALLEAFDRTAVSEEQLAALCNQYPDCADELQSTYTLWRALGEEAIPEPGATMDAGFYKMLNEQVSQPAQRRPRAGLVTWKAVYWKWGVAAACIFLLGMASGILFWPRQVDSTVVSLNENKAVEQTPDLAMLTSNESATKRLMSVQQIKKREVLDDQIIAALNEVLLYDENENVRLSAIETMLYFADNPKVRECMIKAIPHQQSPLIQVTLAEVMVALKDPRAIKEIQLLLQDEQLELEVKIKMEETIELLL